MTSRVLRYLSVALVALLALATLAGTADAKKKRGVGKSVDSSEIEDGTIQCADISAAVFPNGCPDDDSGAAPSPGPGTGTSNVQTFDANLTTNQTKSISARGYTLSAGPTGPGGACTNIELTNTNGLLVALIDDADAQAFNATAAAGSAVLDTGSPAFIQFTGTQILPLGPGVAGQASQANLVAGVCQTAGYLVG